MVDTAFEPDRIRVTKGERLRFVFTNGGKVQHEAFVGSAEEQAEHEKKMKKGDGGGHGGHGGGGDDGRRTTVAPGDMGELTYRFEAVGTFEIGCHEAGHYEAGMKIAVVVA